MKFRSESEVIQYAYQHLPSPYLYGKIYSVSVYLNEKGDPQDVAVVSFRYREKDDSGATWKFVSIERNGLPWKEYLASIKPIKLRYDTIEPAFVLKLDIHPEEHMQQLGFEVLSAEPMPIGDCWIFEVIAIKEPLPSYLEIVE